MREIFGTAGQVQNYEGGKSDEEQMILVSFKTKTPAPSYGNRVDSSTSSNSNSAIQTTFNFLVGSSMILFVFLIVFPKGLRRQFAKAGEKKEGKWSWSCKRKDFYQSKKDEYSDLFPNGDKSLVDQYSDEESRIGQRSGNGNGNGNGKSGSRNGSGDTASCTASGASGSSADRNNSVHKNKEGTAVATAPPPPPPQVPSPHSRLLLSKRRNYGSSLPVLDTNFVSTCSIKKAGAAEYDELSPLDCIQNDQQFDDVFRDKGSTKKKKKNKKNVFSKVKEMRKDVKKSVSPKPPFQPQPQLVVMNENVNPQPRIQPQSQPDPQPTLRPQPQPLSQSEQYSQHHESKSQSPFRSQRTQKSAITPSSVVSSNVFSLDSNLFSPPATIMDAVNNTKETSRDNSLNKSIIMHNNNKSNNNQSILIEKQINSLNYETPQTIRTYNTAKSGKSSLKMDFTPSPLSIFSNQQNFEDDKYICSQAVVILISSDILYPEQHVQQQNALMVLLSDKFHLPVKVVDGNQEKNRKRREELFRMSGLRGQYPQIFFVDENRGLTYFGNHVSLDKLLDFSTTSAKKHAGTSAISSNDANGISGPFSDLLKVNEDGVLDASFFSI